MSKTQFLVLCNWKVLESSLAAFSNSCLTAVVLTEYRQVVWLLDINSLAHL